MVLGKIMKSKTQGSKRKAEDQNEEDAKKSRQQIKKEKIAKLKESKPYYAASSNVKHLWEELRTNIPKHRQHELCIEIVGIMEGKMAEFVFHHDTTRVVQAVVKLGPPHVKEQVFQELRECVHKLAISKYGKFLLRKILKYGTKSHVDYILKSFNSNVVKLLCNKNAADLLEFAYTDYASPLQKSQMVEEFYGPSFSLFRSTEVRSLADIIESDPDKKNVIISNLRDVLTNLINKNVCQYSIVHKALLEYFTHVKTAQIKEMIETVRDSLIHMIHTKEGAHVAMCCLWNGTPKDRKHIIKSFKTYVDKVCMEEYGYMVLLAAFDCVDDTSMMKKVIIEEISKSIDSIVNDNYGRKVLTYLQNPRQSSMLPDHVIETLQSGDDNPNSRKPKDVRQRELLQYISPCLLKYLQNNITDFIGDNQRIKVLEQTLLHTSGDPTNVMRSLGEVAAQPFVVGGVDGNLHIIENTVSYTMIKHLIAGDLKRKEANEKVLFSQILLDIVPASSFKEWTSCNRGCFTLADILKLEIPELSKKIKTGLKKTKESLKRSELKGAQILYNKL